jgi:hypothetical protein
MRIRGMVLAALTATLVLAVGSVAVAGTATPTISASKTALQYPHSALLTVSAPTTPSAIVRRLAGASEWTTLPVGIETTQATVSVHPTSTAAYAAVCEGVTSDPVTITVAAQLSKPQINARGHKGRKMWIKGWLAPRHFGGGDVQLKFYRWEKDGTATVTTKRNGKVVRTRKVATHGWVQQGGAIDVPLVRQNWVKSKWSYRWTAAARGTWKIVVSHEDVAHAYSSASARSVIKR